MMHRVVIAANTNKRLVIIELLNVRWIQLSDNCIGKRFLAIIVLAIQEDITTR